MKVFISPQAFDRVKVELIGDRNDYLPNFTLKLPCKLALVGNTAIDFISLEGLVGKSVCLTLENAVKLSRLGRFTATVVQSSTLSYHFDLRDIHFLADTKE